MFKNAKILEKAPEVKGKKAPREEVKVKGVEEFAQLAAAEKAIASAKAVLQESMVETVSAKFMKDIKDSGGKTPDSFNAVEGLGSINCQLKKRSTASALNEEERQILDGAKVPYHRQVTTPKLFAINPNYATDEKMLEKVEKALAKLGLPDDFIVVQEEQAKYVIDDKALDKALKSGDKEIVKLATTLAFKPTLSEVKPAEIAKTIEKVLGIYKDDEEAAEKPAAKAKTKAAK